MESFAFAVRGEAMPILMAGGMFQEAADGPAGGAGGAYDFALKESFANFVKVGAILGGEYRLSQLLLGAGKNIGSHLLKYRGVDFRNPANWACKWY